MQSVIESAYAKLGGIVRTEGKIDPGTFCFFGVPFEGLLINDIGGKGRSRRPARRRSRSCAPTVWTWIWISPRQTASPTSEMSEVELMDYDVTFGRTERVMSEVLALGGVPVVAGGSHSITEAHAAGVFRALWQNVGVVWFDGASRFHARLQGRPALLRLPASPSRRGRAPAA